MPNDPDRDGWLKSPLGSRTCQGRLGRFKGALSWPISARSGRGVVAMAAVVARASGLKTLARGGFMPVAGKRWRYQ